MIPGVEARAFFITCSTIPSALIPFLQSRERQIDPRGAQQAEFS
jgi:hypothetical protein